MEVHYIGSYRMHPDRSSCLGSSVNWFLPRSETYWKTTIIRKWIPCRAAKQRVVFSSAASGSQQAERYRPYCVKGQSTLVLRTKSYNTFSEPSHPSGYQPETMAGECLNSEMEYAIKDHKILPMIVICLCKVDFHLGLRQLCRQGGKNLVFQHEVKNDLLFGCLSKKFATHSPPRGHWADERD